MSNKKLKKQITRKYGKCLSKLVASNLFKSFGFLKHCLLFGQWSFFRTEVQGQVKPLNCIILQLSGKFTLAQVC
jgi:hypothetical protein